MTRRTLAAAILSLIPGAAFAQQRRRINERMGNWEYLGEANVDGGADHDRIDVGRRDGAFRSIQLRVSNAPIDFDRVVVHYESGQDEVLPVRQKIAPGRTTRAIDLQGGRRFVRSVELWYNRARPNSRKPKVQLYGRV